MCALCAMEAEPDVAKLRDMIQHAKAMADRLEELESQLDTLSHQGTGMCSACSWPCTGCARERSQQHFARWQKQGSSLA